MLIMVNYDRRNDGVLVKELHLCAMIAGLKLPTDPRWVNLAAMDIGAILTDHAYCEQKAASSCISIIQQFPDYNQVVKVLASSKSIQKLSMLPWKTTGRYWLRPFKPFYEEKALKIPMKCLRRSQELVKE